jgi:2-iminobutanoate/2-iminopropanoate deaminase
MLTSITHPDVHTVDAPYSVAVRSGQLVIVSGTVPTDAEGKLVGRGDIVAQARQVFLNIQRLLDAAGADLGDVALLTYYLTDISQWSSLRSIRREFFAEPYPATTTVEVARLIDSDWLLEVEALAVLPTP